MHAGRAALQQAKSEWYDARGTKFSKRESAMKRIMISAALGLAIGMAWAAKASRAQEKPPLRVAIAGLVHGHVDGFFRGALKRQDIQIVGIADPDRALFAMYAKKYGLDDKLYYADLEEMVKATKPQAVLGYTSTFDHRKLVETCAKLGVPVMMEKPLAVSASDAYAIAKAAKDGKITVLVNYETSWYPSNHEAYDLAHSGALGDIRKVVVHDGHSGPKEIGVGPEFLSWLTDPKLNGGGALFDFGCYGADLMTWLMNGAKPLTVTAVTQQIKPEIYPKVDDEATIVITYPKAQAIIQASWNWPFDRKDMEVYGATGSVVTVKRDAVMVRRKGEPEAKMEKANPVAPPYDDSLTYLRAVLLDGAKVDGLSSLETNVTVTQILDAARESAKTGKRVSIAQ
jgi:glucose-fructose oxidoreductase